MRSSQNAQDSDEGNASHTSLFEFLDQRATRESRLTGLDRLSRLGHDGEDEPVVAFGAHGLNRRG